MATETSSSTPLPEMKTTVFPSNGQLLVEETDDLLTASLAAMRADIAATPAWGGALPPEDDFLLMFLRAEVFSPSKAADRYRKFWEVKVELCGEDKAALPIRAKDVKEALDLQFFQMIPGGKDVEGRQIVLVIPGNNDKKMDNKLRIRAAWYVMLAALEEVEVQRRGICFVGLANTAKFSQIDPNFTKTMLGSIQGALPVRVGSMNICHPPAFFRVVWGIISVVLHKRIKKRIKIFPGTDTDIREALRSIISPDDLPIPIGTKTLDFATWTENRIKAEAIKMPPSMIS